MDNSIDLASVALLLGSAQGIFLVIMLVTARGGQRNANRILGIFTLIFSITLIDEFLVRSEYYRQYPGLIGIVWPTNFLYGPLLLFYIRALTMPEGFSLRLIDWLHFLGFGLSAILLIPVYDLSASAKIALLYGQPGSAETALITAGALATIVGAASVLQTGVYLGLALRRLVRHGKTVRELFTSIEHINLVWLRNFIAALCILWLLFAFAQLISPTSGVVRRAAEYALHLAIVVVIYVMGYLGLRQPAIFSDRQRAYLSPENTFPATSESAAGAETIKTKYRKSTLSAEHGDKILTDLLRIMDTERPYLESELTLSQLAAVLGISPNHMSQVINERLHKNFFDFVNQYRVEAAKRLLSQGAHAGNVLEIALHVGFNSKSAFYTAFRQHTGMTPSQFRSRSTSPAAAV